MSSFDPTDLKYQVTEEFKPDKEKTWTHAAEEDGWSHAHNAIRKELELLQDCFDAILSRGGAFEEWEVKSLQKVFHAHHDFIHMHHTNEDKILAPKVQTRFKYPDKLTDDHDGIVEALSVLSSKINSLKAGDSRKEKMDDVIAGFKPYSSNLREHLKEEEDMGLPLVRAYFTPKEYAAITAEILQKAPKLELGGFIYVMGPEKFRKNFMKQEGIPFFVWYLEFKGAVKLYETEVVEHINAIKAGAEPLPPTKSLLCC